MEYLLSLRLAQQTLASIYPKGTAEGDWVDGTLLQRFSLLILSGEVSSDQEAVAALYGADKPANYSPYQKLKSKFKRYFPMACTRLPANDDLMPSGRTATSFCMILYAHASLCSKKGLYPAAERLLNTAWKIADKSKVIISLYLISQSLTALYAARLPHPEKFSFFKAAYEEYARLFVIERRCANNRYRLDAMAFERSRRLENRIATAAQLAAENREMAEGLYYPSLFINNHTTQINAAMLAGEHSLALKRCEEALVQLENCYSQIEVLKPFLLNIKSRILAKMRNYEAFIQNIELAKLAEPAKEGHIVLQSHVAIVCLGTDHFQEAAQALENIRLREVAQYFSPENGDMMKFIFAYVHTLYRLGYIAEEAMPAHIRQFRMTKFFNDSPTYERNKQGYNVHFIVLQLFNYLINEDYNGFFDKAESIEKYRQRYLQDEDGRRNGLLLQMLVSPQLHDFEREATREANLERLDQLKQSNNLAEELDMYFYEFIPYERLWDLYLEALD